ncbi:MAG: GAF domain-containing protein, partial [Chloroflexota bacterium]|nr:GAF domain-containing protein [Chloroflexota bacterium]
LLPVAFVVPILFSWLILTGQRAGYYETALGMTLLALAITLLLSIIIWFNAKGLTRVDMDRRRAEEALHLARDQAEQAADRIARLQKVTAALSESLTPAQVAKVVVDQGAPALGAATGTMMLLTEDGQNLEIEYSVSPLAVIQPYQRFPISVSVPAADAARSGEPIWIESRQQYLELYPHLADQINLWNHQGAVAVPLLDKGRILGVIALSFDNIMPYTLRDQDYALTLARQVAQALERARLYEAEQQARQVATEFAQQQEALYKLADQLQRASSLEDVFNAALDAILGALQCDRASILLFDDAAVMRFVAWRGLSDNYRKATDGHSPWTLDAKDPEPICVNDIATGDISDSLRTVINGEGIGSLAFIPLVSHGKLIGKFMTYFNTPHVFSESELELSLTIARQLAFGVDRRRAEEALRRNEEMFSTLVDAAPFGVYFIDSEFRLRAINKGSEQVFSGIHPLIGRDFAEILSIIWQEPFATEAIERFRHTLLTGESFISTPIIEQRANIEEIEAYDWQIHRITLPDGTYGVVCYFYDLSEQKQMEASVRASESLYRTIARSIPGGGVYVVDNEFRYIVAEGSVTGAFGLSREMLEGHTVSEAFPQEMSARMEERLQRTFAGETIKYETRHNGRVYWTQQAPLLDSLGHAIIVTMDITERKQAEEALSESKERYRNLFDLVPVAVYVCDASGLIQEFNHRAIELWGREPLKNNPKEKFCGSFKIYYPDGRFMPHEKCPMARMLKGEKLEPHELEILVERADGVRKNVLAHPLALKNEHGEIVGAINCLYDITERKQAEEALHQLNVQLESRVQKRTVELQTVNQSLRDEIAERLKMEDALHESGKRLQILSQRLVEVQEEERRAIARELHDSVGQSLSALNINLVILDNQISNDANEQIRTRLNDSMQLTAETISFVRDVMSDLRPSVLDDYGLEAALQSYLDQFKSRYGINIMFERPDQPLRRLGSSIEMTFLRIAQEALLNIARHAHADQVNLSLEQNRNAVCLIVQDNGSGIESWQDANRPGSHGLTIMRERADAVGGNLRVLSIPGKGTKVEVSIPVENGSLQTVQEERRE